MAPFLRFLLLVLGMLAATGGWPARAGGFPQGLAVVSGSTADGPLALAAYNASAGAVCWMAWNNKQFLDAKDHGRCLQSAVSFDWLGEAFNPTEAGASMATDGLLPSPGSSLLLNNVASASQLHTQTQMAFWFPVAGQRRSAHILRKYVQVGAAGLPNAVDWQVEFEVPPGETHAMGQFEFLTGYMPPEFSVFSTFDPRTGTLAPLADGPGEQPLPLVFATPDFKYAIGVWTPHDLAALSGGYGRWRFVDCVKWNMVARVRNPQGTLRFRALFVVGNFAQVQAGLAALVRAVPGG